MSKSNSTHHNNNDIPKNPHAKQPLLGYISVIFLSVLFAILITWLTKNLAWGMLFGLAIFTVWQSFIITQFCYWLKHQDTHIPSRLPKQLHTLAIKINTDRLEQLRTHKKNLSLIKKVRSTLLALQDSVVLLDSKGHLEWWNKSAEDLLQLSAEQKNTHIFTIIKDKNFCSYFSEQQLAIINSKAKNGQDFYSEDYEGVRLRSPSDNHRYIQCEMTTVVDETLLVLYDVTRVQHLEKMRQDFVANVSHELRTPLTVLMGYIEMFSDSADIDPKWQRGFGLMAQQTKRMNSIVNDLLMLSRLENEEKFATSCIDMPKLLTSLFDDAQVYNKEYKHLIDLHIDSQKSILGSEAYLTSALLNLITNAIKYTPKGGEIQIAWTAVKDGYLFSVSDNGLGIAAQHVDRLTERFYRVDSGRSRQTGGTGLGLAIVKHVLYQHGATLKINSVEGKGSTFKIYFPLSKGC